MDGLNETATSSSDTPASKNQADSGQLAAGSVLGTGKIERRMLNVERRLAAAFNVRHSSFDIRQFAVSSCDQTAELSFRP